MIDSNGIFNIAHEETISLEQLARTDHWHDAFVISFKIPNNASEIYSRR